MKSRTSSFDSSTYGDVFSFAPLPQFVKAQPFVGGSQSTEWDGTFESTALGGSKADTLSGGGYDDLIYGGGAYTAPNDAGDAIFGYAGHDQLFGNGGNDLMFGNARIDDTSPFDNDTMYGGIGNDTMLGGGGNDYLFGGEGHDLLSGGSGSMNFLYGGAGNDIFSLIVFSNFSAQNQPVSVSWVMDMESTDMLSIQRSATIKSFEDFMRHGVSDGTGAFFNLGDGRSVELVGVHLEELTPYNVYIWG
jgi:hypothetical protein